MEEAHVERVRHLIEKLQLNPEEESYFARMVAAMGEDDYWEAYAASVKAMGILQLKGLEPEDFAASVRIEEARKAELEKEPERVIEIFHLNREEQTYLMQMVATSSESHYLAAYAESVKSVGLEQLQTIEPGDFAASVRLEEERKIEGNYEYMLETEEERAAKKGKQAQTVLAKAQHLRFGKDVISNAEEFLEKNRQLLEKKLNRPNPPELVSIKFQRQREGGLTRNQVRTDFEKLLVESIQYDVMRYGIHKAAVGPDVCCL